MGNKTNEKSSSAEFRLILEKAEKGDAAAQNTLGEYYRSGKGVDADLSKAVKWFKKRQNKVTQRRSITSGIITI